MSSPVGKHVSALLEVGGSRVGLEQGGGAEPHSVLAQFPSSPNLAACFRNILCFFFCHRLLSCDNGGGGWGS